MFSLYLIKLMFTIWTLLCLPYNTIVFFFTRTNPYTRPILKKHPKMTYTLLVFLIALSVYGISGKFSNSYLLTFFLLSVFRYTRLIVNIFAFVNLKGHYVDGTQTFNAINCSVVIPTVFKDSAEVMRCLQRIHACKPKQIIVVTRNDTVSKVKASIAEINSQILNIKEHLNVTVIGVDIFNKRTQMVAALQQAVTGEIVAFADDDVFWPNSQFVDIMLSCFENPLVGACGPSQRVQRDATWLGIPGLINFLGICYLERRNFNTGATNFIDGAVSTLSGRTSFYRASLIQNDTFYDWFMNAANHDDDKNLTRWVYDHDLQITLQFHPQARILTTLETSPKMFINQCMRWARGHWRGNFRVMQTTTYWYNTHIWSLYAIYIGQFQTPAFLIDSSLWFLLSRGLSNSHMYTRQFSLILLVCWIFFTKIVKLIPHFRQYPQDMLYIPPMIMFSYFHGILNVYALITRDNTIWGR
jgi:hypothetical protein